MEQLPRRPIEVTVEIPSGSRNKYEYDHARHRYVLGQGPVLERGRYLALSER